MTPKLSLVTGTRNRPESFARMLDSIINHTTVPWELVVSDASDDPIVCSDERVRIIPERPRLTCTKGYNVAFRAAVGEFLLFLNDDAEVCEGYDTTAIDFMEKHPRVGLGALHYSEDGGPFHVNSAWGTIYANFGIFRKSVGESVGFFDEDLQMYGCDNSIAIRILMADLGVSDIPGANIIHHSVKDQQRIENQRYRHRDNETLSSKYMPYRDEWALNYRQLKVQTGTIPWVHGRAPELSAQ